MNPGPSGVQANGDGPGEAELTLGDSEAAGPLGSARASAPADPGGATGACEGADLAEGVASLVPVFPPGAIGEARGPSLVLYDASPGELRASWALGRDDLERFVASFPADSQRPAPVLRLRRARSEGGSEPVAEVSLLAVAREGTGSTGFRVGAGPFAYEAELGLSNGDGGWLMLARSNPVWAAARVGLDLRQAAAVPPGETPDAEGPDETVADDPISDPSLRVPAPAPGLEPVFPLTAEGLCPRPAEAAAPGPGWGAQTGAPAEPRGPEGLGAEAPPQSPGSGPASADRREAGPPGQGRRGVDLETRGGASQADLGAVLGAVPAPPAYGVPPATEVVLQVEAELRISGRATPDTWVDLFGHPFRVGPGGRFQLTLRVSDPDLLRRALDLNPPPELGKPREER